MKETLFYCGIALGLTWLLLVFRGWLLRPRRMRWRIYRVYILPADDPRSRGADSTPPSAFHRWAARLMPRPRGSGRQPAA